MISRLPLVLPALFLLIAPARADELKSFPAAKHGNGELKYVDRVPVLVMKGKPAEMGEQFGALAIKNAPDLPGLHKNFLKDSGMEGRYPIILTLARQLKPNFPKHHLEELEAATADFEGHESRMIFANGRARL